MLAEMEANLFSMMRKQVGFAADIPTSIFILGAPRTGSTFFYQLLVKTYQLPFISNLTNEYFPVHPLIGLWLQSAQASKEPISLVSSYGKSVGLFQPSEGSAVMRGWFGGEHPSQSRSVRALPDREAHMIDTLRLVEKLYGKPLVIKNAWNCFRVDYLIDALPGATFIWIRRDIRAAACSDLAARYTVHGNPTVWNSATPSNLDSLRARPYAEQVVENQYEFNRAIQSGLAKLPTERWAEVWYEDLCEEPAEVLQGLGNALPLLGGPLENGIDVSPTTKKYYGLNEKDYQNVLTHVGNSLDRVWSMIHTGAP